MTRTSMLAKAGGISLIVFASIIIVVEIVLHVMSVVDGKRYSMNYVMLIIAFVVGFVGMYILSPPRAKEGGQFLVDNAIRIVQVIRAGRRKGDPMTAIVEDNSGHTATMIIPSPIETEPLFETAEIEIPSRRKTDKMIPPSPPSEGDRRGTGTDTGSTSASS